MDIQQFVQELGIDSEDIPDLLAQLAIQAYRQYERLRSRNEIDMAVELARESIRITYNGDTSLPGRLSNLGSMLVSRYERMGQMGDLEEAIEVARQAVDSTPDDHPDRAACLNNLGNNLGRRYERTGQMGDLEEAIEVARQAVDSTPEDYPDRAGRLNNLGNNLGRRYERTRQIGDLEEAIEVTRQAVDSTPDDHPDRAGRLNNLGNNLGRRYERTGQIGDLEEVVEIARQAVDSTPDDHPNRAAWLNNLGNNLWRRYERTDQIGDLEEAIEIARQAVDSTPDDHPNRAACLNNLGNNLGSRYERTGQMGDLEEAIEVARQAVDSIPDDHPDRAGCLNNLGNNLGSRYERTGQIGDLEEAIEVARQAVDSIPDHHPNRAACLNNLGNNLRSRYERTGQMGDLEEAIEIAIQAVDSTPEDYPDRAGRLNNLGNNLGRRYERTGQIGDLEKAIEIARQAVDSTPDDHPNRAGCLNNLGNNFRSRYERTGQMGDLEEAIEVARQAVDSIPDGHPDRASWLNNLGNNLRSRYERTGRMSDLEEASLRLRAAWHCQTAVPFHRVKAAARCLKLLAIQRRPDIAIQLGKDLIDLLPDVNTRLINRADQQFVISTFAGVATDLCAFLLDSNQPANALYYLEKGRAVIISQLVNARSDMSSLAQQYPDIARRYGQLWDEVNTPLRKLEQDVVKAQALTRRREAVTELEACIKGIREIAGYERFLLGQTTTEMQECAAGGTIVVVNIASLRSDAILISSAVIKTFNLPRLAASDAETWLGKKWTGRRSERAQKNKEYLEYLSWLWEACVEQIIDEVCNSHGALTILPRIWWIGTGLASSMPFHAAGIHSGSSTENALSRVISSYTPSIKALEHARYRAKAAESARGSLLIATMPTTPGSGADPDSGKPLDLPGVIEEKHRVVDVARHLPIQHLNLPSVEQVVNGLRNCCIAHFACHGYTDHLDPSNSGLILQSGEGRRAEQDRLTVRRVSELCLGNAQVAYLSACSTAENKAARLADEVIHVVSGFQVAGFPHVVGCLWPSIDRVCVEVASGFYSSLLRQEVTRCDGREVAWAVREAVLAVRAREMSMPLMWAPFVHYGA